MATVITRPTGARGPVKVRKERLFRDQPRWFGTLFTVDVWERFSFYGMTVILYLYFVAPVAEGGIGLAAGDAAALFGTYMSAHSLATPGQSPTPDQLVTMITDFFGSALSSTGG